MISPNLCSTFNGSSPPRLLAQARLTCSVAESSMSNECCIVQPYKKPLQSSRRFQRLPEMPWTASTSDVSLKEMLIRNACTMKSSAAEEEKKTHGPVNNTYLLALLAMPATFSLHRLLLPVRVVQGVRIFAHLAEFPSKCQSKFRPACKLTLTPACRRRGIES